GVGFIVDLKGRKSHDLVQKAIQILVNLEHRGACGCEANTGDGAGILLQMPHRFLAEAAEAVKVKLPPPGAYGVGMAFLPTNPTHRRQCEGLFEKIVREEGQRVLGWRDVPRDNSMIGPTARSGEPVMRQIFIARDDKIFDDLAFERKLYVIR